MHYLNGSREITSTGKEKPPIPRDKNFNTRQQNAIDRKRVFCDGTGHRLIDCSEGKDPAKRRQLVRLCFNCLKHGHHQLVFQAASTLNATGSNMHYCASTINYKTTSAAEIKWQEIRWWIPLCLLTPWSLKPAMTGNLKPSYRSILTKMTWKLWDVTGSNIVKY